MTVINHSVGAINKAKFKFLTVILAIGACSFFATYVLLNKCTNVKRVIEEKIDNVNVTKTEVQNVTESTLVTTDSLKIKTRSYEDIVNDFRERRDRVRHMCDSVDGLKDRVESVYKRAISNMIVDTNHNLTWCPVYKAASTMWMKNFALLSGASLNQILIKYSAIVKQKYLYIDSFDKKLEKMNSTIKFMIVRHPFERLLSAYRDKLEHTHDRQFYYMRYGKYIRQKYRDVHSNLTSLEPTFQEFLQFLAKEKFFDEHWVPFVKSCQPCSIDYNYIIKFESLKDEYNVFIKENDLVDYFDYASNDRENTSSQGITNDLVSEKYFRDIPESLLLSIFEIYELDFLLFSYSPDKYYSMSKSQYYKIEN